MLLSDTQLAISALLDEFIDLIRTRDRALIDILWGDGDFILIGSERDEICQTREELAAKLDAVFSQPTRLEVDFPHRRMRASGNVAWLFVEGTITRCAPDGRRRTGPYLAACVFEHADGFWRWRQFFGSEPG